MLAKGSFKKGYWFHADRGDWCWCRWRCLRAALAKAGSDVTFVARGDHLAAMHRHGLTLMSPRGDLHLNPVKATDVPASIGEVDFVLFCVKLWDVESAGAAIRPIVGPNTAVIPLQNGIDASDRLIPILGKEAVMGEVAQISATIAEPGVIRQTGTFMRLVFGELDGRPSQRGAAFQSLCEAAKFEAVNSNSVLTALWEKFVLLATNSSVAALTRLPFGKLRDDPEVLALFEKEWPRLPPWVAHAALRWPRSWRPRPCRQRAIFPRKCCPQWRWI